MRHYYVLYVSQKEVGSLEGLLLSYRPSDRDLTLLILRMVSVQKHRVVNPEGQLHTETTRMSVAYFLYPDDDCVIQPIDGSNNSAGIPYHHSCPSTRSRMFVKSCPPNAWHSRWRCR